WFIIKANLNETLQEAHIHYNDEANAIFWQSDGQIDLRKTGGLTWAKPYEGIATELDFNEYYPHILAYGSTCWPIGPGEFKTFTHISINPINFNLKYGIYHVFIRGQPADLDLHIELSSESPNALIFGPNQLIRGDEIFYQWASYLTKIKHKGGQASIVAKHMLVSLWGRLYSDRRRPGPHRRIAPFISARDAKQYQKNQIT
ncbi:8689_t:CDS:2, partial [Racocetra persica]